MKEEKNEHIRKPRGWDLLDRKENAWREKMKYQVADVLAKVHTKGKFIFKAQNIRNEKIKFGKARNGFSHLKWPEILMI